MKHGEESRRFPLTTPLERAYHRPSGKALYDRSWHAALARAPLTRVCTKGVGAPRLSERQGHLETPFFPYIFELVPK